MDMMKMMFSDAEREKIFTQTTTMFKQLVRDVLNEYGFVPIAAMRDTSCFARARARGEQTFTLVQHDPTAPELIRKWAELNETNCPIRAQQAVDEARAWEQWQAQHIDRTHPANDDAVQQELPIDGGLGSNTTT